MTKDSRHPSFKPNLPTPNRMLIYLGYILMIKNVPCCSFRHCHPQPSLCNPQGRAGRILFFTSIRGECWTITSDIEKKIEAAEMWFIRRMLKISWAEKKTNVNVLREGNVQRSLLKTIRKRQMEFLGHVCRRRGLEFLSLTGKVEGKRDRGKQRITFLDSLCNSATGGQSKGLNFLKLSDDRDVWRGMVANVCSRSGT